MDRYDALQTLWASQYEKNNASQDQAEKFATALLREFANWLGAKTGRLGFVAGVPPKGNAFAQCSACEALRREEGGSWSFLFLISIGGTPASGPLELTFRVRFREDGMRHVASLSDAREFPVDALVRETEFMQPIFAALHEQVERKIREQR